MTKLVGLALVVVAMLSIWHLAVFTSMPTTPNLTLNPITDVAVVSLPPASESGVTGSIPDAAVNSILGMIAAPIVERKLNDTARQYFDVYAMVLPYRMVFASEKKANNLSGQNAPAKSGFPRSGSAQTGMTFYKNARFGFELRCPASFKQGVESEDGDGSSFTSSDGSSITVYGSNNDGESVDELYQQALKKIEVEPSYFKQSTNWFVLSWRRNGFVFYTKEFVGTGSINFLDIQYPESEITTYDKVVEQVVRSFRPGNLDAAD